MFQSSGIRCKPFFTLSLGGTCPFLFFNFPPAWFSVWVSLSEIEAAESCSSLKKGPPDMPNGASFGCNCLTNVREFQRRQKARKEKANQPSENRRRVKIGSKVRLHRGNGIVYYDKVCLGRQKTEDRPLPSICKDVEENPCFWGCNTKLGVQETQAALRQLPSPKKGLSSS